MKRFFITLAVSLSSLLAYAPAVMANGVVFGTNDICSGGQTTQSHACQAAPANALNGVLIKAVNLGALVAGLVAVVFVIVGAVRLILSEGDTAKIEQARSTIIYSVAGLLIVAFARAIVGFVIGKFQP